jgi:hypothetical protein
VRSVARVGKKRTKCTAIEEKKCKKVANHI